ncbi:MAG TPA: UDP-N-acetylmuramate dehydrogenase [Candidatus Saccharibacteria bacterium]|nr:UDP-N-acetylmuramate dehydrogenase [Candidatus Saccharibacteria bacterium]
MDIQKDVALADFSTMRLGGKARYLVHISDKNALVDALAWADEHKLKTIVIGGGSNIVWGDKGFDGLVIVNHILGFKIHPEDKEFSYVTVGAGENWDSVVKRTVAAGLHGIEALSLIPGSAGATPVQNVGAYGQEIADSLVSVEAYDNVHNKFITIPNKDCAFGYRTSRFKTADKGRFVIVGLTFRLRHINPRPPHYPAVANYLREHRINVVTPKTLRKAVIAIRSSKLPDPTKVANNGSFFANPIVGTTAYNSLAKEYPEMPHWDVSKTKVKLSAAWLIEHAGFKNFSDKETGMATWPSQPLVLVNNHAKTTKDLLKFRDTIISAVHKKFSIHLEQEPELIG